MQAVVLSVGDELVLGQTVDTNAAWLSARLAESGVRTAWQLTVPDDRAAIAAAIQRAAGDAACVVVSGGLGPTEDDQSRQALAEALGVPLQTDAACLQTLLAVFQRRGRRMPEANRVQAMRPASAAPLVNPHGTAPGLRAELGGATVWLLPGVPSEMRAMFDQHVTLAASERTGRAAASVILTDKLQTFGVGESTVAEQLGELTERGRNPTVSTTAAGGVVSVRLRAEAPTEEETRRRLEETRAEAERRLGTLVFGRGDETLAGVLGSLLRRAGRTVATAESCTGGWLGHLLTEPAGASDYYAGGWVTYTNALKQAALGVPADLLERHGAVSDPVVRAMAAGAAARAAADHALAITGVAGPSGGSAEKPVGTVWVGLAGRDGTISRHAVFPGDREGVRERSARAAMDLLRRSLLGETETPTDA